MDRNLDWGEFKASASMPHAFFCVGKESFYINIIVCLVCFYLVNIIADLLGSDLGLEWNDPLMV